MNSKIGIPIFCQENRREVRGFAPSCRSPFEIRQWQLGRGVPMPIDGGNLSANPTALSISSERA